MTQDLAIGTILSGPTKRITLSNIRDFEKCSALLWDQDPGDNLHTSEAKARSAGFDRPIASGMMSVSYLDELLTTTFGARWTQSGNLSLAFIAPARAGDEVRAMAEISERAREPGGYVTSLTVWCERGDGTKTSAGTASLLA